jgi:hypothetical protein
MKHNTIMSVVIILVAIGLGYFLITHNASNNINGSTDQGKLNINVVCDSALTYMTFPSSVEADQFIAECKEGKHPEVIEHYKAQMNLGDGAAL